MKKLWIILGGMIISTSTMAPVLSIKHIDKKEVFNIEKIKNELIALVNPIDFNKAWKQEELNEVIDNANFDKVGGIVITNIDNNIDNSIQSITFKGMGDETQTDFSFKYFGEITIEHHVDQIEIIDISTIEQDLTELLNPESKKRQPWQFEDLQKVVDDKYGVGEITLTIPEPDPTQFINSSYSQDYIFKGNAEKTIDNQFKYYGETGVLTHHFDQSDAAQPLENLRQELTDLVNTSQKWDKGTLNKAIDDANFDAAGGITVSEIRSASDGSKTYEMIQIVGNAELYEDKNYKYNSYIEVKHILKLPIDQIRKELQGLVNTVRGKKWIDYDFEQAIYGAGLDNQYGVKVEKADTLSSGTEASTIKYKITALKDSKFEESTSTIIEQYLMNDTTKDINTLKTIIPNFSGANSKLQTKDIISEKVVLLWWNKNAVVNFKDSKADGIKVVSVSQEESADVYHVKAVAIIRGLGSVDNDWNFNGETEVTIWRDK